MPALTPLTAHAAPHSGGNYGAYAFEGQYPTVGGCAGTFRQVGPTKASTTPTRRSAATSTDVSRAPCRRATATP